MATQLGKAYVQIVPSARGIKGAISKEMGGEATVAGHAFGGRMMGTVGKVIAAAGIGKVISSSITEGANLQQSLGGIETLFKDSADKVKANAAKAFQTAGMSANQYMEMTTGFAASLLGSLGNNTNKAADMADMAMTDMSDNANKMGTSMEMIQNAYQGFAKQNYTMLDNLKLGYGGTKTEMQRLLADAQKVTGVKYDITNLADVYSAIHVIQGELDITGTTAKEASSTFSGSFSAMKASAQNLIAGISLGQDISGHLTSLQGTIQTFLVGNLLPMVWNVVKTLPQLIGNALSSLAGSLNFISKNSDTVVSEGVNFVTSLVGGISQNLPTLLEAGVNMVMSLGESFLNADWVTISADVIGVLSSGLTENLPQMLSKGSEIVMSIIGGILRSLPTMISSAFSLASKFIAGLMQQAPAFLSTGAQMLLRLVNGIITNLPQIASSAVTAAVRFIATIGQNLPRFLQSGIQIIGKLAAGLIQAIPSLVGKIPQIIRSVRQAFTNTDWWSIGKNIISGIANGLRNAGSALWEAVKGVLGSFKDKVLGFFGIHSPSRWGIWVGEMIDRGFAEGVSGNVGVVQNATMRLESAVKSPFSRLQDARGIGGSGQGMDILGLLQMIIELLKVIVEKDPEFRVILKEREIGRVLKEMGVVFA